MIRSIATLFFTSLVAISANAKDKSIDAFVTEMTKANEFCYSVSAMASVSVNLRNEGDSLENQLARKKEKLTEGEYNLVESIVKQIYEKDLTDPSKVASDSHQACIEIKGFAKYYYPKAIEVCPLVGIMVAEVSSLKAAGKTEQEIDELLGARYKDIKTTSGKSVLGVAKQYATQNSGLFEYKMCMIVGMAPSK
jgi:hypothetical protein